MEVKQGPYVQMPDDFEWTDELLTFDRRCYWHDWYYDYSDDHGAWIRGRQLHQQLAKDASASPETTAIYEKHVDRVFNKVKK